MHYKRPVKTAVVVKGHSLRCCAKKITVNGKEQAQPVHTLRKNVIDISKSMEIDKKLFSVYPGLRFE